MEEKVKKREWVKNAAIIFLAVMLVLTFFSNTMMNASLPEVATQYITSGTIETKVRGTGKVVANENYEVTLSKSRKVESVLIKEGQEVTAGDVLFTLSSEPSTELSGAQDTLSQLKLSYQKALINAVEADYAKENRDIEKAKTALEKAQVKRDGLKLDPSAITDAEAAIAAAKIKVESCEAALSKAQNRLDELGGLSSGGSTSALYAQLNAAKLSLQNAKNALETAKLIYGTAYDTLVQAATDKIIEDYGQAAYDALSTKDKEALIDKKLPIYLPAEAEKHKGTEDEPGAEYTAYVQIKACEDEIKKCEASVTSITAKYDDALNQDNSYDYNRYSAAVKTAQSNLTDAQELLKTKEDRLADLKAQKSDYEAAEASVDSCQTTLEDLVFALEEQRKSDGKTQQIEALDLQESLRQIAAQQKIVNELSGTEGESEVKAKVSGTISQINVTAGKTVDADSSLASIQIGDMGFSLSFSVTKEQARKVRVGDTASISNFYYGSKIDATLRTIKTDPQNPQTSMLLLFDITGDVSVGDNLTLSVGQKSSEYDYVVPNSALRSDTNGDFIYIITAKNSPLGNRYIATRVDVSIVASDDTSSAVTGALNDYDYVITTSTKPISEGDKVKMPE